MLALLAATPSLAQSTDTQAANQPPEEQAAAEETGENVVVTAQLREQRPVEVPFALTTYSGRFLEDLNIQEFEDLARFTPGFAVQNQSPNNPAISIRGITVDQRLLLLRAASRFTRTASRSPSRAAPMSSCSTSSGSKSPRARNRPLRARRADRRGQHRPGKARLDDTFGMVRGEMGNLDYWLGEAMLNALSPKVGLRVAGRYKTRDGTVESLLPGVDDFNSVETGAARAILRFEPSETLTFDVIGNYQKDTPSGTSFKSLLYRPTDPVTGAVLGGLDIDDGAALAPAPASRAARTWPRPRSLGLHRPRQGRAEPGLTLNSITAYREFDTLESSTSTAPRCRSSPAPRSSTTSSSARNSG